jgi:hypothetical protein
MKKFLKTIMACALISSMFVTVAQAAVEDAECLSLELKSGLVYYVCLEGEAKNSSMSSRVKSEILELAHSVKKSSAKAGKLASKKRMGYMYSPDYTETEPVYPDHYNTASVPANNDPNQGINPEEDPAVQQCLAAGNPPEMCGVSSI